MPNTVKKFIIKQKVADGHLILHPETEIAQIVDFESGVNSLIANAAFPRFGLLVVNELPTGDDIRTDKIYLVTGNSADNDVGNVFTEYVRVGDSWEILGEQRSALPLATTTNVGVVRIGENINVDSAGLISVNTATDTVKGVVKVGANIDLDAGTISVKKGSTTDFGLLKVGDNIDVTDSVISVKKGSTSDFGLLKVGENIDVSSSVISVKKGDATNYGLLKVGTNIDVNDSTISVKTGSITDKGVLQVGDNIDVTSAGVISIKKTSTTDYGVVKIGTNLDVTNGVVSVKTGSTTDKGIVQVGTNIDVDANGVISVKDGSTTDKGVLKVGDYLNVTSGTVNADISTTSAPGVVQTGDRLTVTAAGLLSADKQYEVIDNSAGGTATPDDLATGFIWFEITGDGTDGLTASTLVLTAPDSIALGSNLSVTATVTPNTATGSVKFTLDGSDAGTFTLANATYTRVFTGLTEGTHTITCLYSGDNTYRSDSAEIANITVTA